VQFPPGVIEVAVELGDQSFQPFNPQDETFRRRLDFDRERLSDLLSLVAQGPTGAALDLGAPPYLVTATLLQGGFDVTANGLPIGGYETAGTLRVRYTDGSERQARLSLFDAEGVFPHPSEAFDLIVAGEIFEHLYRQPWMLFAEAWRCLRPGGHLLVTTPNGHSIDRLLQWIKRGSTGMGFNPHAPSVRHAREYSIEEISDIVRSQGFVVHQVFTRNYSHITEEGFPGALGPFKRLLYRALHRLSERKTGLLRNRGQQIFLLAIRSTRRPTAPPEWMLYAIGDERGGFNFPPGTSCD
jgi:SAM-dependent methyltransferase